PGRKSLRWCRVAQNPGILVNRGKVRVAEDLRVQLVRTHPKPLYPSFPSALQTASKRARPLISGRKICLSCKADADVLTAEKPWPIAPPCPTGFLQGKSNQGVLTNGPIKRLGALSDSRMITVYSIS